MRDGWHLTLIDVRFVALGRCVSQHFFFSFFDMETTLCTRPALRNHLFHISHPHFRFSRAWFSIERAINRCQEVNRLLLCIRWARMTETSKKSREVNKCVNSAEFHLLARGLPIYEYEHRKCDYCWSTRPNIHPIFVLSLRDICLWASRPFDMWSAGSYAKKWIFANDVIHGSLFRMDTHWKRIRIKRQLHFKHRFFLFLSLSA